MTVIEALILSIIQGLTEFLPISSSGHIAIGSAIMGGEVADLRFFAITHLGTMMATLWVFWDSIETLFKSLATIPQAIRERKMGADLKLVLYIIIASIPTGIIGLLLENKFEDFAHNIVIVGSMLLVTGGLLFITRLVKPGKLNSENFGVARSFVVGIAQGIAIMPGISRSGATVSASLLLQGEREFSGNFAFLISIPAILAANIFSLRKAFQGTCLLGSISKNLPLIIGFFVSFGVGLVALKVLLNLIKKGKFWLFAFYCFFIGAIVIILGVLGIL